jgi:hypothetical protein
MARGTVPWSDDDSRSKSVERLEEEQLCAYLLAACLTSVQLRRPSSNSNMSLSLSSKSKGYSKLESDLPTHVRASQTRGTVHTPSRMRQAAVVITCVGIALLFGGLSCGYSVHRSQDVVRNPAYLIKAKSGAVASENILCSEIGVDVMKDGGNAVDAAVATTFCTGVVNMFS